MPGASSPNDNYSRDSHLKETVYTGNYINSIHYTPVISVQGIYIKIFAVYQHLSIGDTRQLL